MKLMVVSDLRNWKKRVGQKPQICVSPSAGLLAKTWCKYCNMGEGDGEEQRGKADTTDDADSFRGKCVQVNDRSSCVPLSGGCDMHKMEFGGLCRTLRYVEMYLGECIRYGTR